MATALREIRKHQGLTQRELAQRAGISVPYVSYLENGLQPPRSGVRVAVAHALNVPVTVLFPECDHGS
jgi:transcriptional regulator with XRE-family HTH domain